jgi:hypothetical protein
MGLRGGSGGSGFISSRIASNTVRKRASYFLSSSSSLRGSYTKTSTARAGTSRSASREQFHLFAGRASTETMRANQFRMDLFGMAYVLVSGLRRLGLKATELATAQAATIREKLFKIGARVTVSVRRVWLSMACYPRQGLFRQVWANLRR